MIMDTDEGMDGTDMDGIGAADHGDAITGGGTAMIGEDATDIIGITETTGATGIIEDTGIMEDMAGTEDSMEVDTADMVADITEEDIMAVATEDMVVDIMAVDTEDMADTVEDTNSIQS